MHIQFTWQWHGRVLSTLIARSHTRPSLICMGPTPPPSLETNVVTEGYILAKSHQPSSHNEHFLPPLDGHQIFASITLCCEA